MIVPVVSNNVQAIRTIKTTRTTETTSITWIELSSIRTILIVGGKCGLDASEV